MSDDDLLTDKHWSRALLLSRGVDVDRPTPMDDHDAHIRAYSEALLRWTDPMDEHASRLLREHIAAHVKLWTEAQKRMQ